MEEIVVPTSWIKKIDDKAKEKRSTAPDDLQAEKNPGLQSDVQELNVIIGAKFNPNTAPTMPISYNDMERGRIVRTVRYWPYHYICWYLDM